MKFPAFDYARPTSLADAVRLLAERGDGAAILAKGVRLGASVRWCDIEGNGDLAIAHPLLVEATRHVAHYQIRNRGTVGGSIALADPAAELPGIAVTCEADISLTGSSGVRVVGAGDFFLGPMATCLDSGEIVTEIHFPPWPKEK